MDAWRLTQIPYCEIITQQKTLCFGALAGFNFPFFFFFFQGRLPVFFCLLLLITSNNSVVVLCQTPKATLTPCGLSHHLVLSLLSFPLSSPPYFCSVARNLTKGPRLPAIDPLVVMMAERLLAPGSDLGAGAGLRKAWIAIDFYLIQSFHLDSNLLPGAL